MKKNKNTLWKRLGAIAVAGSLVMLSLVVARPSFADTQMGTSTTDTSGTSSAPMNPWTWDGNTSNWVWSDASSTPWNWNFGSSTSPWGTSSTTAASSTNGTWTWNGMSWVWPGTSSTTPPWELNSGTGTSTSTSTGQTGTGDTGGTGTTTSTSTNSDIATLQAEITVLQQQVATLQTQVQNLLNGSNGTTTGSTTGTSTNANYPYMMLSPTSLSVLRGQTIDFSGANFPHEENVNIYRNGVLVGMAHADGGGNFTTGSMSMPTTPGVYTFNFVGATTGVSMTSTITVQ